MDNGGCHYKLQFRIPNMSTTKDNIVTFIKDYSLKIYDPLPIKCVFLEVIKDSNIKTELISDEISQQHGHGIAKVACLPLQLKHYRAGMGSFKMNCQTRECHSINKFKCLPDLGRVMLV